MFLCVQGSNVELHGGTLKHPKLQKQARGLTTQPIASMVQGMGLGGMEDLGTMLNDAKSRTKASGTPSGMEVKKRAPPPAPPNLLLAAMKTGENGIKRAPQVRRASGFEQHPLCRGEFL